MKSHAITPRMCLHVLLPSVLWLTTLTTPAASAFGTVCYEVGSSYYVDSVGGADSNSGTSETQPWQTLAPVNKHNFQPGDVIYLMRGSTWTGQLTIDDSGTSDNPITFTTYGSGNRPIFRNPGSPSNWTRAVVINADWVVVEGILVRDTQSDGVYISRGSDHNIVRDIEVTDVGTGIAIGGRYNLVTRNYIHDLHIVKDTPGGNDDFGATGVTFYNSNNEASYNKLERCIAPSQDYGQDGGGFELLVNSDGNYIHHNWVNESDGFLEVGMASARGVTVAYNVSVNNNGKFSLISLTGSYGSVVEDFHVENNTIIETVPHKSRKLINFVGNPSEGTYILHNNILYIDSIFSVFDETGFTHDYNLYNLSGGTRLGATLGEHEQIANPQFVGLSNNNLHLQPGSPAIDAGIDLQHSLDFDGRPVPAGAAPDLGAFEYGVVSVTPTPTPSPTATLMAVSTATDTPTPTTALTPTNTPKPTLTDTPFPTYTPALTPTNIPTPTNTPMPLPTDTPVPTNTAMPTSTKTYTPTPMDEPTPSYRPTLPPTVQKRFQIFLPFIHGQGELTME
jgi:hypothetical protein